MKREGSPRCLETDHICDTRDLLRSPHDCPGRGVSQVRLTNTRLTSGVSLLMSQARDNSADTVRGIRVGYTRVSTIAQTLDEQNAALEAAGVTKTFSDTMSGARYDRPGLAALMEYVREGDTVVVSLGQLAAFIQQQIRHRYRRQRPTPLPSRTAKSCQGMVSSRFTAPSIRPAPRPHRKGLGYPMRTLMPETP